MKRNCDDCGVLVASLESIQLSPDRIVCTTCYKVLTELKQPQSPLRLRLCNGFFRIGTGDGWEDTASTCQDLYNLCRSVGLPVDNLCSSHPLEEFYLKNRGD